MSLALTIGGCLALCTSLRRLAVARRRAPASTAVNVAITVAAEPFAFPAAPAFSRGREVLAYVASGDAGEVIEFPIGKGWDLVSIATVLAEIASL